MTFDQPHTIVLARRFCYAVEGKLRGEHSTANIFLNMLYGMSSCLRHVCPDFYDPKTTVGAAFHDITMCEAAINSFGNSDDEFIDWTKGVMLLRAMQCFRHILPPEKLKQSA